MLAPALARFPVELLARKHGRPLEQRSPDAERGRAGRVVDEVANEPFDARTFEYKDHYLLGEEDAMPPKTGLVEAVRRAPGEDPTRSLAGAWSEPGDDRQALSHVTAARGYLFLGLVAPIRHFG
jgi:hypothetical protein